MSLQLLTETDHISLYLDDVNDWLYVDWQGDITLPIVQSSCMTISKYFLQGSYTKVLNDNTNVLSLGPDVSPWLAQEYLPYIVMGGIEYMAWVYSPNMSTQCYTDLALYDLVAPVVALFDDTATACTWLKSAKFKPSASAKAQVHDAEKIIQALKAKHGTAQLVQALEHRLFTYDSPLPRG